MVSDKMMSTYRWRTVPGFNVRRVEQRIRTIVRCDTPEAPHESNTSVVVERVDAGWLMSGQRIDLSKKKLKPKRCCFCVFHVSCLCVPSSTSAP